MGRRYTELAAYSVESTYENLMAGSSTKGATVIGAPKGPSAPERMLATQASAMPSCSLLRYVGVGGVGYLAGICGPTLEDATNAVCSKTPMFVAPTVMPH